MQNEFNRLLRLIRNDFRGTLYNHCEYSDEQNSIDCIISQKMASIIHFTFISDENHHFRDFLTNQYQKNLVSACRMNQVVQELAADANKRKLRFAVIKGLAFNNCIYGEALVRESDDIDLLIAEDDASAFHRTLLEQGFRQKHGQTSFGSKHDKYSVARLAAYADKTTISSGTLKYPSRSNLGKKEYDPYVKVNTPTVELHYGFYRIADSKRVFAECDISSDTSYGLVMLPPEMNFIFLLINTFENSESFQSNSYDFCAKLRDYVDLRFFFEKYKSASFWPKINRLIDDFDLRDVAAVCLGNLEDIYLRDVTFGCLPPIKPKSSEWESSIIERMKDPAYARQQSLRVMRRRFRERAEGTLICSSVTNCADTDKHLVPCSCLPNISFAIEHTDVSLVLILVLPETYIQKGGEYLYQFRFTPLSNSTSFTFYKVDLCTDSKHFTVYGHRTRQFTAAAIRKAGRELTQKVKICEGYREIRVVLPFSELELVAPLGDCEYCISFEVFTRHHDDIYQRMGDLEIGDNFMLLVIQD